MSVHATEKTRLESKTWIQTFSGGQFWPLEPRAEDVSIEDVAHALSMKCRFTGHTREFYSVAEHCVRVSQLVSPAFALPALLHDAGEAYLPDVAAPVKSAFYAAPGPRTFSAIESKVLDAIFEGLGISALRSVAESEQVKTADLQMLAAEVRDLMSSPPADWGLTVAPGFDWTVHPWSPSEAKQRFLARFRELS